MTGPYKVEYSCNGKGNIVFPKGPPFDGNPVLIKVGAGWCEAWWDKGRFIDRMEGPDYEGFEWVCMDGDFVHELDDASWWMPLPILPEGSEI